jgi:hypothetical protein
LQSLAVSPVHQQGESMERDEEDAATAPARTEETAEQGAEGDRAALDLQCCDGEALQRYEG